MLHPARLLGGKLLTSFCLLSFAAPAVVAQAQAAPAEHLVWSDEFDRPGAALDPANWSYETGNHNGWGNHELETYCGPATTQPPCDPAQPNAFIAADGLLHIAARRNASSGQWTSARITTKGLHSFQYGRIEARIRIPAGAGVWPAFWMLGDNIDTLHWPACGELDIMENVGKTPLEIRGSIHGRGFTGVPVTHVLTLPTGKPFADDFHTYGLIWSPGKIQYYLDDPAHPYATYTRDSLPPGAVWPFDDGKYFILLNLAIGGDWPGPPNASTPSPAEMLVDYVRVYQTTPQ